MIKKALYVIVLSGMIFLGSAIAKQDTVKAACCGIPPVCPGSPGCPPSNSN